MKFSQKLPYPCLVAAFFLLAPSGRAQQPPSQAGGYSLKFDDEFNTLDLSPNGLGFYTWYQDVWFKHQAPLSNSTDSSGKLELSWTANQSVGDTTITTLSLDRLHYTAFRYGYFEARMKWDPVEGAWPSFWMIPVQSATGQDNYNGVTEYGELDIFEGSGTNPKTFYGTIHDWKNGQQTFNRTNFYSLPENNNFSNFHTYGLLWEPGKVTWYYDDSPLHSEATPAIFDMQDYFLLLSMTEGVNWHEGDRTGISADKMTLTVNWVRVWQK